MVLAVMLVVLVMVVVVVVMVSAVVLVVVVVVVMAMPKTRIKKLTGRSSHERFRAFPHVPKRLRMANVNTKTGAKARGGVRGGGQTGLTFVARVQQRKNAKSNTCKSGDRRGPCVVKRGGGGLEGGAGGRTHLLLVLAI